MTEATSGAAEWRRYWTLPVAAAIGYSTAVLHTYTIGSFMQPLQQEFGWSRAQISAGITITGIAGAVFGLPMGMLVDRWGPRTVGLIGVTLMTATFAGLGTATGTEANWILLWCLVAFANLWLGATVWTSAVASRFEASRGFAFGITLSGASVAAMIFPLLVTMLIETYGWRTAFFAMGGVWALLVLPVMLFFFRGARDGATKKSATATEALETAQAAEGISVGEGLRDFAFYKLLIASGIFTFTALGVIVHFVPILKDRGSDAMAAAGVASLIGLFSIVGRLATGALLDRFAGHLVGAVAFLLPIVAIALLLLDGANPVSQSAAAAAFGLTLGAEIDVIAYLVSRYFGLKNFGVLFGAMVAAMGVGVAFGPLAAGAAYDHFNGYAQFLTLAAISMAVASLALATLGRPRFVAAAH